MADYGKNLGKYLHPSKTAGKVRSAGMRHEKSLEVKSQEKSKEAKLKTYKNPATGGVRG
jgi:hypothetical protein